MKKIGLNFSRFLLFKLSFVSLSPSARVDKVCRCSFVGVWRTKMSRLTVPLWPGKERWIQFGFCRVERWTNLIFWSSRQLRHKCEELEREIMARTSVEIPTTPDAMSVNSNQSQQWTQSSAVWDALGYANPMLLGPTSNMKAIATQFGHTIDP